MVVALGCRDGVHVVDDLDAPSPRRTLETEGKVFDVTWADGTWFAAAVDGLFRSAALESWERLELPVDATAVTAVGASPAAARLYVGTMPAECVFSDDAGDTWQRSAGFGEIDSRDRWWNLDVPPHLRSVATHPAAPDRVVVGLDGGGVHVSDDRGESWAERRGGLVHFVHALEAIGPDEYVAATDAGLFWTLDGGEWWDYLYRDATEHRYFRGLCRDGRTIYSGGAHSQPPAWGGPRGADAALYRIELEPPTGGDPSTRSLTYEPVPYPGEPRELVLSGATADGELVCGTNAGRLLRLVDGGWETAARLDGDVQIRCLATDD